MNTKFDFKEFSKKYQEFFVNLKLEEPIRKPYYLMDDYEKGDGYKNDFNYVLLFMKDNKPIDIRIVKTEETLKKFIKNKHLKYKLDILFHPNPVKLTREFWEQYRQSKSGAERLKLFKEMNVLADSNMLFIDTIIVDIDTEFSKSIEVLKKLVKEIDIDIDYLHIRKTKSGNLRFAFKVSPMRPDGLNKNGKTNLANVKEFVSIVNEFFKLYGCKADNSFKRINHPVWITKSEEVWNEKNTEEITNVEEDIFSELKKSSYLNFYEIYRKAKELNKKILVEKNKKKKNKKKKVKYLPAFVLNNLKHIEDLTILEKAVGSLARKVGKGGRYISFLQPVAGWCKWLGLSYEEYYELVFEYASDKERDIKTAWKYAKPLEFKEFETHRKKYDLVEYAEKVIHYLKEQWTAERQELLKEVFENQKWLELLVMEELCSKGIVKFEFVKAGRGRPKKVYSLDRNIQEKEEVLTYTFNKPKGVSVAVNSEEVKGNYFSQYNNSLLKRESLLVEDGFIRLNSFSLSGSRDLALDIGYEKGLERDKEKREFKEREKEKVLEIEKERELEEREFREREVEKSSYSQEEVEKNSYSQYQEKNFYSQDKISTVGGAKGETEVYEYDNNDIEFIADLFVSDVSYAIPCSEPLQNQKTTADPEDDEQEWIRKIDNLIKEERKEFENSYAVLHDPPTAPSTVPETQLTLSTEPALDEQEWIRKIEELISEKRKETDKFRK